MSNDNQDPDRSAPGEPSVAAPDEIAGKRIRREVSLTQALISVVVAVIVTVVVLTTVLRPHGHSIGAWISGFLKSSGMAGLCAVGAATIAWRGIVRQVHATQENTRRQADVDQRDGWLKQFEWIADRAVPASKNATALPPALVYTTLAQLTEAASNDVQKAMARAIADAITPSTAKISDKTAIGEADEATSMYHAAQTYARAAGTSPAASPRVSHLVYELKVLETLKQMPSLDHLEVGGIISYDDRGSHRREPVNAIATGRGKRVAIDIKSYLGQPFGGYPTRLLKERAVRTGGYDGILLIVPFDTKEEFPHLRDVPGYRVITWHPEDNPERLTTEVDAFISSLGGESTGLAQPPRGIMHSNAT